MAENALVLGSVKGGFGSKKGRFANKNRQKLTKIDAIFGMVVLRRKGLGDLCTENRAAKSLFLFNLPENSADRWADVAARGEHPEGDEDAVLVRLPIMK